MKTTLEQIGLSKDQSKIYLLLVQNNPLSPSDIVRQTKIVRPSVYKALKELLDIDLIRTVPSGKNKKYTAESPDRLEDMMKDIEDNFSSEIYHLHDAFNHKDRKPIVTFAQGDKAIRNAYSDVVHSLKKGDTYYRYSPNMNVEKRRLLPKDYRYVRDKKQLERLIITNYESVSSIKKKLGRVVRWAPKGNDLFADKVQHWIYGNKVMIVDYNTKTVITIENKMIAEFQKRLFKLLFERLG